MASLSEELAKLANPTPVFRDPEDDIDDDTTAKIVQNDYDEDFDDDGDDDNQFSQLRRQTAAILADSDNRYAGAKVTRKTLKKISNDDDSDDEIDQSAIDALEKSLKGEDESMDEDDGDSDDHDAIDDDDDDDDAIDDEDLQMFKSELSTDKKGIYFEDDGDYSKYADDDDDDDDGDSDEEDEYKDEKKKYDNEDSEIEEDDDDDDEEEDGGIESFSRSNQSEEIQKGKAAQSQLGLWDNLLEERIKVQKVGSVINQLPQPSTWDLFMKQGGDNYKQAVTDAQSVLKKLLDSLLQAQTLLLHQNQETRHVVDGTDPKLDNGSKPNSDDDEEITSESETESAPVVEKPQRQQTDIQGLKRKFKMSDYPDFLAKRHTGFATYRNETLHKWNDKTRLASGKIKGKSFSALEQSALKQIEQIMRDKDRLIRRTQLKRSGQRILGVEEKVAEENQRRAEDNQEAAAATASPGDDYDGEVFDDSDFYHQLLRELIERKTSELNDPVAISRQWLEIEKLRTKVKKKKVDTRASKGRKIRYDVHAKLVNFMAPMDHSIWSDDARNDLFKSLFGKTVRI
ncbi:protein AATF-like [Haliotis rubra]|uniref:protein AATF-like n=1 Tax=Haliotis rubra TaxID=36100 RepID=UPI001EE537C7|nr:protein AATF-like [Haliotis rubra]